MPLSSYSSSSRPRVNPLSALGFDICSECPAAASTSSMAGEQASAAFAIPTSSPAVPAATTFTLSNPFSSMSFTPLEKPRLTQEVLLPAPSMLRRKKRQQDLKWTLLALLSASLWIWAMFDYGVLSLDGVASATGLNHFLGAGTRLTAVSDSSASGSGVDKRHADGHLEAARRSYRRAVLDSTYPTYVRSDFESRDSPIRYKPGFESKVPAGSPHVPVPLKNPFLDITYPTKVSVDRLVGELRDDMNDDIVEDLWDEFTIDTSHEAGQAAEELVDWKDMILDDAIEDAPRNK